MRIIIVLFVLAMFKVKAQEQFSITVNFTGMQSDKGNLFVQLFNEEAQFLKIGVQKKIVEVKNKKARVVFNNVKRGYYAIAVFHDENDNKKMDTNFVGMPKEPTGTSNNAKQLFGPPKYEDAKFKLDKNTNLKITVK
ncbi:MAG: DUF2141 domain-containing protein [Tenacibaculum sp.]